MGTSSCSSSETARDDEGSGECSENSKKSEGGRDGGKESSSDLAGWKVGGISSALTARLPFVLVPERIVIDNSEIMLVV